MDISKDYIKMCEKATEIQELKKEITGNYFYQKKTDDDYLCGSFICWNGYRPSAGYHNWNDNWYFPDNCVWLPRQDQLQDIVFEKATTYRLYNNRILELVEVFGKYCKTPDYLMFSMEQLWLAFVMKELYNKTWNGEDWVKCEI